MRDVMEGNLSHPFVKHAWEEHEGEQPEIIMRIISKHESTMDRQLTEAVRISRMFGGDMSENLNAKAEWGILRTSTIGIMIQRTEGKMRVKQEEWQEGTRKERSNRENETGVRRSGGKNEPNEEMKGKRKLWKPKNEKENPHDHVKRQKIAEKEEEEERENETRIKNENENDETETEKTRREKKLEKTKEQEKQRKTKEEINIDNKPLEKHWRR